MFISVNTIITISRWVYTNAQATASNGCRNSSGMSNVQVYQDATF